MRSIYLDLAEISTPEELHQELKRALRLPTWYGGNLDALYDCLTSLSKPVCLELDGLEGLGDIQFRLRWWEEVSNFSHSLTNQF